MSIALGMVAAAVFVQRQSRLYHPLVDLAAFRVRDFTVSLSVNWLGILVLAGTFLFITEYFQLVVGPSPLPAGLSTIRRRSPRSRADCSHRCLGRLSRPPHATAIGLLVAIVGCALLMLASTAIGFAAVIAGSVILCLGIAPVITLATGSIISAATQERASSAASLSETSIELGGSLGTAMLGSFGVWVYRSQLDHQLPAAASRQDAARPMETLGGATRRVY